jgi:hypothetical protein
MGEMRNAYKILKREGKRPLGELRDRMKDDIIRMDFRKFV